MYPDSQFDARFDPGTLADTSLTGQSVPPPVGDPIAPDPHPPNPVKPEPIQPGPGDPILPGRPQTPQPGPGQRPQGIIGQPSRRLSALTPLGLR